MAKKIGVLIRDLRVLLFDLREPELRLNREVLNQLYL